MLDKKWMVLAIFFISLVAISGVSAAEDAGDVAAIETDTQTDIITTDTATDEIQSDALKVSADDESDDVLAASNDEEISADESNCYVNSSYTGTGHGTIEEPYKDLYTALNAEGRKDGDIIHIAAGVYVGVNNTNLEIKNNLSFTNWELGEVVFDANGEGRIFNVLAREINITGITFKNAMNEMGGAIIFENGLVNSHIGGSFINNHAGTGGAICILGTIENSLISAYFENNTALTGGAIYAENITHTEINGDFFNNAAILMESPGSDFPIGVGGAIATVFIEDSLIEGDFRFNRAGNLGGAIFVLESMDRSNITGGFMHNSALVGGAANIFTIRNSKIKASFENNTALIGGAINVNIINSTEIDSYFINNTADLNLMDLVDDATKEEIEYYLEKYVDSKILEYIVNYTVAHGINLGFGGGIAVDGIVLNSNITGEFTRNGGADAGGAISVLGVVDGSLISGSFMLNHAGLGGSLFLPVVKNSYIGGGFQSNYAVQGGAIFAVFANHTDICGNFAENDALNNIDLIGADLLAWGGAICIDGVLENSNINGTFYKNRATELGGAIGGVDFAVNSNITGYFIENGAKIGGAIDLPYLKDSTIDGYFVNNTAAIGGAIMAVFIKNAQINAHFINNTVLNYDVGGVEEIRYNNTNLPVGLGGAICIVGSLEDSKLTGDFILNSAKAGGAVFIYTVGFVPDHDPSHPVRNNTFNSNFVGNGAGLGAAILINGTSLQNKFNSNFISNVAMLGGIVYVYGESIDDSISNCLFMNNTAAGSVLSIGFSSGTNITNNIFLNSARVYDIAVNGDAKLCADNNWFGHNSVNYKDSPKVKGIVCNNWLFLDGSANPASVSYLGSSNIVFNLFVYDNSTKSVKGKFDHTLLEPVNLTIASTNGKVDKKIVTFGDVIKFSSNGKKGTVTAAIGTAQDTVVISCLPRLAGNNLVMDYLGNNYKIQVFDTNGDPVAGETVKMTVNGKTYTVKSDKKGYATLPIQLKPKTYVVTSKYKGFVLKNTLKVKNTLKAKKAFSVKKSAKKLVLKATLKWSTGKAIANKRVSFKFNGKTFTVKTNKEGIAKITLAVKLINKGKIKLTFNNNAVQLKVGKKYKMIIRYRNETVSSKLVVKK